MSEFDAFAGNYQDLVSDSVRITGDSSEYFARYKAAYIARELESVEKLLDYGCGVGLLSLHLKSQLPETQIDGFDLSKDSLQRVDHSLRLQGVFTADPKELAKDYGIIVIANVLHHVRPEGRQKLIRQITTRLAPKGRLVIFEHNPINPLTQWAVSQCPFDDDAVLLPVREMEAYLRGSELQVLRRDYVVFFPRWLRWFRSLENRLRWLPLGAQYVVVAGHRMNHVRNRRHLKGSGNPSVVKV